MDRYLYIRGSKVIQEVVNNARIKTEGKVRNFKEYMSKGALPTIQYASKLPEVQLLQIQHWSEFQVKEEDVIDKKLQKEKEFKIGLVKMKIAKKSMVMH
jgi:hypothetical protein